MPVAVAGRHVRPDGMGRRRRHHEHGRVLGQRDVAADPRRLKRMAHRLEAGARLGRQLPPQGLAGVLRSVVVISRPREA